MLTALGGVAVLLLAVLVTILVAGGDSGSPSPSAPVSSSSAPVQSATHRVVVAVDSSEPVIRQITSNGPMGRGQNQNVAAPFQHSLTTTPGTPYAATIGVLGPVGAQQGSWVRCTITVDGSVVSQQAGYNGSPALCVVQLTQ